MTVTAAQVTDVDTTTRRTRWPPTRRSSFTVATPRRPARSTTSRARRTSRRSTGRRSRRAGHRHRAARTASTCRTRRRRGRRHVRGHLRLHQRRAPTVAVGDACPVTRHGRRVPPRRAPTHQPDHHRDHRADASPSLSTRQPAAGADGRSARAAACRPTAVIDDDATGNVETSGMFDAGQRRHRLLREPGGHARPVNNAVAVGPTNRLRRDLPVLADDGADAGAAHRARRHRRRAPSDFNPERSSSTTSSLAPTADVNVGDHFAGPIVGVVDYSFGNFKLQVDVTLAARRRRRPGAARRRRRPAPASSPSPRSTSRTSTRATRRRSSTRWPTLIVDNLQSPDIVALEEVQDNNGADQRRHRRRRRRPRHADRRHRGRRRPDLPVPPDRPGRRPGRRRAGRQHPRRLPLPHRPRRSRSSTARAATSTTADDGRRRQRRSRSSRQPRPHRPDQPGVQRPAASRWPASSLQRPRRSSSSPTTSTRRAATSRCSAASSRRRGSSEVQRTSRRTSSHDFVDADPGRRRRARTWSSLGDLNDFEFSDAADHRSKGDGAHTT